MPLSAAYFNAGLHSYGTGSNVAFGSTDSMSVQACATYTVFGAQTPRGPFDLAAARGSGAGRPRGIPGGPPSSSEARLELDTARTRRAHDSQDPYGVCGTKTVTAAGRRLPTSDRRRRTRDSPPRSLETTDVFEHVTTARPRHGGVTQPPHDVQFLTAKDHFLVARASRSPC